MKPNLNTSKMFSVLDKRKPSTPSPAMTDPPPKRRSSGFLRSLMYDSKDALFAPFHPSRRKSSSASEASSKEKGTQTKLTDVCQFNGTLGGSSATFFSQRYPAYAQRKRRSSRARSDPSTRSLTNLSTLSGLAPNNPHSRNNVGAPPQSFTLPARLEPSLLSPDWHSHSVPLRRSPSSAFSAPSGPGAFQRLTSTSSCPSEAERFSVWHFLVDPLVEELMKYPWGKDSLWLMAFVVLASSLVLVGYVITTVLPTMLLAVAIAVIKSLIFNHQETVAHLKQLTQSARSSVFTQEFMDSLRSSSLEAVNRMLQLVLPPALPKT
ncbi:uncharacterized protein LOC100903485 [Galendromus occidentalis]|uniref:Uncharacterized protein LOC100903485 n=1 Tax=Galendromus occidentalis TaxID=34638 RepID=A0AAJ6QM97_9ACAR|nr:uncharacterized protein LOC100903485 [Galendromus occidentalis]